MLQRMRESGERHIGKESRFGIPKPTLASLKITPKEASESVALFLQADVVREAAAKSLRPGSVG